MTAPVGFIGQTLPLQLTTEATVMIWMRLLIATQPGADANRTAWPFAVKAGDGTSMGCHYPFTDGNIYINTFKTTRPAGFAPLASVNRTSMHLCSLSSLPGANGWRFFQNGQLVQTATGDSTIATDATYRIGCNTYEVTSSYYGLYGTIAAVAVWNRALTDAEHWALYDPRTRWDMCWMPSNVAYSKAPSSAGTGAASITLGALTASAMGTVALAGQAAITLGALTSTAAAALALTGTESTTLGALTSSAAGTLALAGAASITLGALTSTASAALDLKGAVSVTLGALSIAATGSSGGINGDLAVTLGALTSTAAAALALSGATSVTLGALTGSATGTLPLSAVAAITLGALVSTADAALALKGAASVTLGVLIIDAQGVGQVTITGSLAVTLGSLVATGAGALGLAAAASVTLGALQSTSAAALALSGAVSVTLGTLVATGAGNLALHAAVSVMLGALTSSSTATMPFTATPELMADLHSTGLIELGWRGGTIELLN